MNTWHLLSDRFLYFSSVDECLSESQILRTNISAVIYQDLVLTREVNIPEHIYMLTVACLTLYVNISEVFVFYVMSISTRALKQFLYSNSLEAFAVKQKNISRYVCVLKKQNWNTAFQSFPFMLTTDFLD